MTINSLKGNQGNVSKCVEIFNPNKSVRHVFIFVKTKKKKIGK